MSGIAKKHIILIVTILLVSGLNTSLAQDDCVTNLQLAERAYESGLIEDIPDLLEKCLKRNQFTQEDRQEAYKLLILSYLFEDERKNAENYLLDFLKDFPSYEIGSSDPVEFVNLYNSFRTKPIFSIVPFVGLNASIVDVTADYGIQNLNNEIANYTPGGVGTQIGVMYNRILYKFVSVNTGMFIKSSKYKYYLEPTSFNELSFTEERNSFTFPAMITLNYQYRSYRFAIHGGGHFELINNASATMVRRYTDNSQNDIIGSGISLIEQRNRINYGWLAGVGVDYRIKRGYLTANVFYYRSAKNAVKDSERYSNDELMYKYYYIDDQFKINNIYLSFGIIYPFYKPTKLP